MSSPSLALRAALALAFLIGFYVLAIAIAIVLIVIPFAVTLAVGQFGRALPYALAAACYLAAGAILWSILPRRDRFVPPGPILRPEEFPRLFEVLRGVARATGQVMPTDVYLMPEFSTWVAQRGGVMGIGGRCVMGLGLSLMQTLPISQLRAALAHEFGHFCSGDTKLEPWVYRTRAAIERTLAGLSGREIVRLPFVLYGNLFLRATLALSRRQEFTADALAARMVGSQVVIEMLRTTGGFARAYHAYWYTQLAPVLDAGYRPPLVDGFRAFVAAPAVRNGIMRYIEREIAVGLSRPYESHPSLRERVVALESLPRGDAPSDDPPAISLLENVPELEVRLLAAVADENAARALKPIAWGDVGARVYFPMWEDKVRRRARTLTGMTVESLASLTLDFGEFGKKLGDPLGATPEEERAGNAAETLGAALALALQRRGWTVTVQLGDGVSAQHGEFTVRPFEAIQQLCFGEIDEDTWWQRCAAAGISHLDLGSGLAS